MTSACDVGILRLFVFAAVFYGFTSSSSAFAWQDSGYIRGSGQVLSFMPDGKRTERELDFMLACDQDCCLTGTFLRRPDIPGFKPIESYGLAKKGNEYAILITLNRTKGKALTISGEWSVDHFSEFRRVNLEDSFDSRYRIAEYGNEAYFALPVFLSWHAVGVAREVFKNGTRGINYLGTNELGTLEVLGAQGIGRIVFKKSASSYFYPGDKPISQLSSKVYPNGLKSITEDYSFSPERRQNVQEPFRCLGTKTETLPDGRSRKTEIKINVTEQGDATTARKFIDAFLEKLPNDKRIITDSGIDVATVLDKGLQKVVVDRDVERLTESRFSNKSPSIYYYIIVLFFLSIIGLIGYLRWAHKAS